MNIPIPRFPYSFSDSFSLNLPLYSLLTKVEGGFVKDRNKVYRFGLIVIDILNYIHQKDLLDFPSTVICDKEMRLAFGFRSFQLSQLPDIIYFNAQLESTLNFEPHEELTLRAMEKAAILRIVLGLAMKKGSQEFFF